MPIQMKWEHVLKKPAESLKRWYVFQNSEILTGERRDTVASNVCE